MHPRIEELVDALDSRRAELTRAVNEVPTSARNRRPSEDRWSVAEVLEHLALVEDNIVLRVSRLVAEQRANGLAAERDSTSVAQTFDLAFMLDRSKDAFGARAAGDAGNPARIGRCGVVRRERAASRARSAQRVSVVLVPRCP